MENITEFCTGCRTCEQVCPKSCISMKFSSEGFLEPFIDLDQCVDCGLCQRRCPQNNLKVYPLSEKVFAVNWHDIFWNKMEYVLEHLIIKDGMLGIKLLGAWMISLRFKVQNMFKAIHCILIQRFVVF